MDLMNTDTAKQIAEKDMFLCKIISKNSIRSGMENHKTMYLHPIGVRYQNISCVAGIHPMEQCYQELWHCVEKKPENVYGLISQKSFGRRHYYINVIRSI
jgi:hypothetical protein